MVRKKPHKEVLERALVGRGLGRAAAAAAAGGGGRGACAAATAAAYQHEGGFLRAPFPLATPPGDPHRSAAPVALVPPVATPVVASPKGGSLGLKLRQSPLGVAFHLRDLLGRGDVVRVSTPAGMLIRLNDEHVTTW